VCKVAALFLYSVACVNKRRANGWGGSCSCQVQATTKTKKKGKKKRKDEEKEGNERWPSKERRVVKDDAVREMRLTARIKFNFSLLCNEKKKR